MRRELDAHNASLVDARRGEGVTVSLRLPDANAAAFVARLNDAGLGRVVWLEDGSASSDRDET